MPVEHRSGVRAAAWVRMKEGHEYRDDVGRQEPDQHARQYPGHARRDSKQKRRHDRIAHHERDLSLVRAMHGPPARPSTTSTNIPMVTCGRPTHKRHPGASGPGSDPAAAVHRRPDDTRNELPGADCLDDLGLDDAQELDRWRRGDVVVCSNPGTHDGGRIRRRWPSTWRRRSYARSARPSRPRRVTRAGSGTPAVRRTRPGCCRRRRRHC
jgi:hypothetical protein